MILKETCVLENCIKNFFFLKKKLFKILKASIYTQLIYLFIHMHQFHMHLLSSVLGQPSEIPRRTQHRTAFMKLTIS